MPVIQLVGSGGGERQRRRHRGRHWEQRAQRWNLAGKRSAETSVSDARNEATVHFFPMCTNLVSSSILMSSNGSSGNNASTSHRIPPSLSLLRSLFLSSCRPEFSPYRPSTDSSSSSHNAHNSHHEDKPKGEFWSQVESAFDLYN